MQLIPLDRKALAVLVIATLLPMIPLLDTAIPLTEILSKLGEFLVWATELSWALLEWRG